MGKIDKWTLDAFKNVKSELLEMQKRRKEIPGEIQQCENSIKESESRVTELEQEQTKLTAQRIECQKQLDHIRQHPPRNTSKNEQENERLRQYWTNAVARTQQAVQDLDDRLEGINSEIRALQNRIQTLQREISQLKSEDEKIVTDCKNHMIEQREVAREAEKVANEHTKASGTFAQVQTVTRFGTNAAASGRQTADNIARNYRKKSGIAIILAELALSIINGENSSGQSSSDGEYSGDFHTEDVMNRGYAKGGRTTERSYSDSTSVGTVSSRQQRFLENYGESSVLVKADGSTDFSKVSYVGSMKYDSSISSYDLDSYVGENKYHITAEQMEEFRKNANVVWRVEGENVYLIPKAGEVCGSSLGYTLEEWNRSDNGNNRGKMRVKKR